MGPSAAIVVAAGGGNRFGAAKQFSTLAGTRLVDRAVAVATAACDTVVLVLPAGVRWDGAPVGSVVPGGATRAASVRCGLAVVPAPTDVVVVHDAARPLAAAALFASVIAAVRAGADAAVPAVSLVDTVKRVDPSGRVHETLRRETLVAVQTPQAFRADALREAHAAAGDATDDAALVEAQGGTVVTVPGDDRNLKVTTPLDLVVATAILGATR